MGIGKLTSAKNKSNVGFIGLARKKKQARLKRQGGKKVMGFGVRHKKVLPENVCKGNICGLKRKVITGEDKAKAVAESCKPNARVAEVAKRLEIDPSDLRRWRREAGVIASKRGTLTANRPVPSAGLAIVIVQSGNVQVSIYRADPVLVIATVRQFLALK